MPFSYCQQVEVPQPNGRKHQMIAKLFNAIATDSARRTIALHTSKGIFTGYS
ncbi:hypothetical protein IFO70_25270 [Phormidium tenue FACHB-886]|nr:hypothetical protein [Phormidium tenue FACHB-886]